MPSNLEDYKYKINSAFDIAQKNDLSEYSAIIKTGVTVYIYEILLEFVKDRVAKSNLSYLLKHWNLDKGDKNSEKINNLMTAVFSAICANKGRQDVEKFVDFYRSLQGN